MPHRKKRSPLYTIVRAPVLLIILGAFVVSGAAIVENMRFVRATYQIFGLMNKIRGYASEQKSFVFDPGADVWETMERLKQVPPSSERVNPWDGAIQVTALSNTDVRIENDLPSRGCRRLVTHLLKTKPADLGFLSIEAKESQGAVWTTVFPQPDASSLARAEAACGNTERSSLALVFSIR